MTKLHGSQPYLSMAEKAMADGGAIDGYAPVVCGGCWVVRQDDATFQWVKTGDIPGLQVLMCYDCWLQSAIPCPAGCGEFVSSSGAKVSWGHDCPRKVML